MVDKEGLTKLKHTAVILYFLQTLFIENRLGNDTGIKSYPILL